jgi:hypothetical protein
MISWALISFSESQTTVRNKMNAHNSIALEELGDGVSQGDCIVRNYSNTDCRCAGGEPVWTILAIPFTTSSLGPEPQQQSLGGVAY